MDQVLTSTVKPRLSTAIPPAVPNELGDTHDGTWLCADGPYLDHIKEYCKLQPNLRLPDPRNHALGLRHTKSRVTLFSFSIGNILQRIDFEGPRALADHFSRPQSTHQCHNPCLQTCDVYLLEGLNSDFIAILGEALCIDPVLFASHERNAEFLGVPGGPSLAPRLPSLLHETQGLTVGYYELRNADQRFESLTVSCAESGRNIYISRLLHKQEIPVIIHRKCSIWTTSIGNDEQWAVLIICDPPLRKAHIWTRESASNAWKSKFVNLETTPFQGGYSDIVPRKFPLNQESRFRGPDRESLYDDLCYYFSEAHQTLPGGLQTPAHATVFARKIIASHYLHLIEYAHATLSVVGLPLQRSNAFSTYAETGLLEKRWSDIQLIYSRCNRYLKDVSFTMLQMDIPLEGPGDREHKVTDWLRSNSDFQHIYTNLMNLKQSAMFLNESLTSLTGIVGNARALSETQRSIREAKTVKSLTLIAVIFIPMTFVSGILSMDTAYLPESERFWVYFAVSIPLFLFVFTITALLEIGYDSTGRWNMAIFKTKIHELNLFK